ncbi:MAG TPA: PadR family transcriptional regulator [Chloroflexota bacterium]|nr:PadR family transcriptional regulator [Chloroflexota bacterium]
MTSTLGFALLGLLARQPRSGYDIAAQLERGVGPFWHARHSQIYPELARLQVDALVDFEVVEQHDRPAKKVYSITDAGRVALADWVVSPPGQAAIRSELTLRAYSIWLADPRRAAAMLREQERIHREQLAHYEGDRQRLERSPGLADPRTPEFATYATLRRGIGYESELAEWCAWLAAELERAAEQVEP